MALPQLLALGAVVLPLAAPIARQEAVQQPLSAAELRPASTFFVENGGQWPAEVSFALRGKDRDLAIHSAGWSWMLRESIKAPEANQFNHPAGSAVQYLDEDELQMAPAHRWARVEIELVGGQSLTPIAVDSDSAPVQFLAGQASQHAAPVTSSQELLCDQVWPGVDLRFLPGEDRLKHQFELAAGIDPGTVQLRVRGAELRIEDDGSLVMQTPLGEVRDAAPIAWQVDGEQRLPVRAQYSITHGIDASYLSFELGEIDTKKALVIDPDTFIYSGFLGGSDYDELRGIDVDTAGNVYVSGHTASVDLPVSGAFQGSYAGGDFDVFVASLDPNGALRWMTYLGGSSRELTYDVSVDPNANVYVAGGTASDDFPTLVGPHLVQAGNLDGFISKFDSNGTLLYSGFLGGEQFDSIRGNYADADGYHYVIGRSLSNDGTFPTEVGPDLTHNEGISDAFVAKISPNGDDVIYASFLGGDEIDYGRDVIADAQGFAYYVGWTNSTQDTFPTLGGPDLTFNGGQQAFGGGSVEQYGDGFLTKVSPNGTSFVSSGYLGGTGADAAFGIDIDAAGFIYVAGHTTSDESSMPVTVGPDLTYNGAPPNEPYGDAWVGKLTPQLTSYVYCGYVGGINQDRAWRMILDGRNRAYLVGNTRSDRASFPHQGTGPRVREGGDEDAFLAAVASDGKRILYATYLAGSARETTRDVTTDANNNVYVTGWTESPEFPVVQGPNLLPLGGRDGFVSRIPSFELLIRAGNAIEPSSYERKDLLFVNGEVGDDVRREVTVASAGGAVIIDVDAVDFAGNPADFALYVWNGEPSDRLATYLDSPNGEAVGTGAFPSPLGTGTAAIDGLSVYLNTSRYKYGLGWPINPSEKQAPLAFDVELPGPGTYTLQAIIEDDSKPGGASLSNAIVVIVQ